MSSRKEQKEQARLAREAKEKEHAASQARTRRLSIIGGVVGLAVIAVIVAVVVGSSGGKTATPTEINARFEGIPQNGVTLGEPGAKATIVEYADLRCPFCKQFSDDSLPKLIDEVIKSGEAKLVFRNLTILDGASPSGKDSTNAANYAAAVSLQNKLFPYVDNFYAKQQSETTDYADEAFLKSVASGITGLDGNKAWDNRTNPKATNLVTQASDLAAEAGVTGTPTFFVGKDEKSATKVDVQDLSDPQAIIDAVRNVQ